jgi:hypothetical protein
MQTTTYYVTQKARSLDTAAAATVHLINDTSCDNGDNRSWDAMRAKVDALFDRDTQGRLGIRIEAEACEPAEDD